MPSDPMEYRATAIDRAVVDQRTVAVVGPLAAVDLDEIRAALVDAANCRSDSRVALVPGTSPLWRYEPHALEEAVSVVAEADTSDLGALLARIRNEPGPRPPLRVLICGDYVVVDYSHALGDGQIGLHLLSALAQPVDRQRSLALADSLDRWSAVRGMWRHFRANPARMRDLIQLRRAHRAPMVDVRDLRDAAVGASKQCVMGYMTPKVTADLRSWALEHAAGATTAAVNLAVTAAALRAEGVALADHIMVLVDCRRYLDEDAPGNGNFAVAVPLKIRQDMAAPDIAATMRAATGSGWPIVVLGLAELKARMARRFGRHVQPPKPAVSTLVRLAFSDLGRPPKFGGVKWATDGRVPRITAFVEPDGAGGITMLITEFDGYRTFTASFLDDVLSVETVKRAMSRLCDDPVGLLRGG